MFAIPGIACLIVFILARPQEFVPLLQRVPFLHLFAAFAVLGWIIDVRLRRLQPISTPAFPWAIAFLGWAMISTVAVVPGKLPRTAIDMAILFVLYATIAHGTQRFRTLQSIAGVLAVTCLFITFVCLHQGLSPTECVGGEDMTGEVHGKPDGRLCDTMVDCYGPDGEPDMQYRCEHVGLFGTHSVMGRVRYRGELMDPNEVALAINAGALSLLIAFARRKRSSFGVFACVAGIGLVLFTDVLSQSRGGLLSAMLVVSIYIVRHYGVWTIVPAAATALPLLMLGGRSGKDAAISTQLRYEAWSSGLAMFKRSPFVGVGPGQFAENHFMTAHNSFVLALAELGFIGLVLFVCLITITIKTLVVGIRQLAAVPNAKVAEVWGMALLASWAGILFQINTLSFAYHSVLWIFLGLVGAWTGAVRAHHPEFNVRLTWRDLMIIIGACVAYTVFVLPIFLRYKGEM